MSKPSDTLTTDSSVFWGEIAPCDHILQIYSDDAVILDALEGFVAGGIEVGDSVIVIATPEHLDALELRLSSRGIDLASACLQDQYIPLNAEETLSRFMVEGWPHDQLFRRTVMELITRARKGDRHVRAFGEMVAVLWGKGHNGATVRLEHLWNQLCQEEGFSLFCAYPRSGFTMDAIKSVNEICATHSRVIGH